MEPDPTGVPAAIREALADADAATCRRTAEYAHALAGERAPDAEPDQPLPDAPEEWARSDEAWDSAVAEAIDDGAPRRAASVVKEINGHAYAYLQWRDGDAVRSQYVAPVNPGT